VFTARYGLNIKCKSGIEDRIRSQASPCRFVVGRVVLGQGFFEYFCFPCQYDSSTSVSPVSMIRVLLFPMSI
jgi:hypothetical protein